MKNTSLTAAAFGLLGVLAACSGESTDQSSPAPSPSQQPNPAVPGDPGTVGDQTPPPDTSNPGDPGAGATTPPAPEEKKTAADYPDLKIETLKEGTGDQAITATDTGKWHYTGTLASGEVFDSSRFNPRGEDTTNYGEPREFGLNGVIKGWTLGLAGMKPGEVRRLTIPPELGYGAGGSGGGVPPNSVLVFEVELVEIVKK